MKQIYLKKMLSAGIMLALSVSASAQTKMQTIVSDTYSSPNIDLTPDEFSMDNIASPYISSKGDESTKFSIYGNDFTVKKSFEVPNVKTDYSSSYQNRKQGYAVTKGDVNEHQESTYDDLGNEVKTFTATAAETYINGRGFTIGNKQETSDAVFYYSNEEWYYFQYSDYGNKYPDQYYKLDKTTNYLYFCNQQYNQIPTYLDEWEDPVQNNNTMSLSPVKFKIANGSDDSKYLSQTLFNNDAAYEYIMPIVTTVDMGEISYKNWDEYRQEEVVAGKETGTTARITGYNVVSDAGATVATFTFDGGFYRDHYNNAVDIIIMGDTKYVAFSGYVKVGDVTKSALAVYSIDSKTSAVRRVAMEVGMHVNPTIANSSDMITVTLEGNSNEVRKVRVIDTAGRTVKAVTVPAGQRSIQLNANELSKGLNIVNVDGKASNNCKVIVR